jgi:hypothetical protein
LQCIKTQLYGVKGIEKQGKGQFPEIVYTKGDMQITLGPDISGGFRLIAVNKVLAEIAKTKPRFKSRN